MQQLITNKKFKMLVFKYKNTIIERIYNLYIDLN